MVENRTERLVTVISLNQDALFRYIFSLLPHNEDARDVLQETLMAITAQFDDYDPSRPFLPWACRFAYFKVMQHRDKSPRHVRFLPRTSWNSWPRTGTLRPLSWNRGWQHSMNAWTSCRRPIASCFRDATS